MEKKVIVAVLLIVVTVVGFILYLVPKKENDQKGPSDRAKEFVKEQQKAGNSEWSNIDLEKAKRPGEITGSQIIDVDGCFTFDLPFPITMQKKIGECSFWFSIDSPKGQVTAYVKKTEIKSLDEDSGVYMRRTNSDKYKELAKNYGAREWLIFKSTSEGYEVSAFDLEGAKLFVLNLVSSTNEDLDAKFFRMLESLKEDN